MMGYSNESKSYRLFDPIKQQSILSRSVIFDETISGNKQLNSSSCLLDNDMFDILEESGSTVAIFGVLTRLMNYTPESTGSWSTMTVEVDNLTSLTHMTDDSPPESPTTCLPWWAIKTIEATRSDA